MATRLDTLITHVRSATENQEFSASIGIPDSEFIRYFNEAQDHIVSKIVAQFKNVFAQEYIFNVVPDQEAYDLPTDAFISNKIVSVEFSNNGQLNSYYLLKAKSMIERSTYYNGHPSSYILRNGKILLNPVPSVASGTIRLNYIKRPCDLEVRRGTVSAVTLNGANNTITALAMTSTTDNVSLINNDHNYICIVDRLGNIKMSGILVASTGVTGLGPYTINVDSSFVYQTGETIAVGDYVVAGRFASTHHQLDDQVERFLVNWTAWKIFKRDSSQQDVSLIESEIVILERDIVESYANIDEGFIVPPILGNFEDWDGI